MSSCRPGSPLKCTPAGAGAGARARSGNCQQAWGRQDVNGQLSLAAYQGGRRRLLVAVTGRCCAQRPHLTPGRSGPG